MKATDGIQKLSIRILSLLMAVLIGLAIFQALRIRSLSRKMSDSAAMVEEEKTSLEKSLQKTQPENYGQRGDKQIEDLEYQLAAAKEELAMVDEQITEAANEEAAKKEAQEERRKLALEEQKKYMGDPAYQERQKKDLESTFAELFDILNLSPDDREKYIEIVMAHDKARNELNMAFQSDGNTPASREQGAERRDRQEALTREYEAELASLLGEDTYATYQAYQGSSAERIFIRNFMPSLNAETMLTDTQREALIAALHENKENVQYISLANIDSREERTAVSKQNQLRIKEAYLDAGRDILSAEQLEKLDVYLQSLGY